MTTRPNVIVSGMIAGVPNQGGASWAILQYLIGLRRLGCEVWLVEPLPGDSVTREAAAYCERIAGRFGLGGRWALLPADREAPSAGMSRREVAEAARRADALINVAGMLDDEDLIGPIPVRAYLDLDPVFTQLWQAVDGVDMGFAGHTHHVSVSDVVGAAGGAIPSCGYRWLPTLPPVVLAEWPVAGTPETRALTTVGHWRSYGSIELDGVRYGQKAHSMRPLVELNSRLPRRLDLAISIHPDEVDDITALERHGWSLLDPRRVAATPDKYRRFVQRSWAELGVTKSGYVLADSGWFSDRSACYLASGRPVVAQNTGFGRRLPVGDGLLAFDDADDVVAAVAELDRDYDRHARAAREIASAYLDSNRVLGSLLERLCG